MAGVIVLVAVLVLFVLFATLVFLGGMLVNIGGQQVGIIERKYFGKPLPQGRVVAMRAEVGLQARVLQPGLHLLVPFIYSVRKDDMLVVAEDEVGLVEAIDGRPLEPGRIFARRVVGHDTFQDGEAFLSNEGQKGPQIDVLPPGKYRINTYLFHIRTDKVVTVAPGQVGVVSARDGEPIRPGRLLAHKVVGHEAFQDGEALSPTAGRSAHRLKPSCQAATASIQISSRSMCNPPRWYQPTKSDLSRRKMARRYPRESS